jgi:hypothetical protein
MTTEERHAQMAAALRTGLPFLRKLGQFHDQWINIVCYGPSLVETWHDINRRDYLPILTVSGAHDFLIRRGLTPSIHVHIDPRPYQKEMLELPTPSTRYLMATVCPPDFWLVLAGFHTELWHLINDDETVEWLHLHHPEGMKSAIGGGSTVGQRAMNVAAALGFRRFRVYGMDFSFGDHHWAGPHPGNDEPIIQVGLGNKTYTTTPHLWKAAREMMDFLGSADVEVEFHGDGLMQDAARTLQKGKIR